MIGLAISEVSNNYDKVIRVDGWKVNIHDSDSSFLVLRDVVYVQKEIKIKFALSLVYETSNLGDPLSRPHFFFRMNEVEHSQSFSICPDDSLWIIIWMKMRELDVEFSLWRD